ncbi:MAG: TlpA family protein disulfide reductase [Alphaproteobacteria bacterium]|nr:TlpA family protein disulfide reductase [Alphaproteobacteria bacterium]
MRQIPVVVRILAATTLAALLYGLGGCSKSPGDLTGLNTGAMANLQLTKSPAAEPSTVFHDAKGGAHTLAEFKGKVLVLNLWAYWCAPCKEEIPSLARLQTEFAGQDVAIVPVSVGKGDDEVKGQAFLAQNPPLAFYTEPTYALAFAFKPTIEGMPTTIIYDRQGVERARLSGGADWSGPDAKKVIEALLQAK